MANRLVSGTVQRRVNDFQTAFCTQFRIQALLQNVLIISINDRLRRVGDHAGSHCFVEVGVLDTSEHIQSVDLCQNGVGCINGHLTAVAAVYLITVVFCGVVAGGNHDTGTALLCTNCIGQHRGRHQFCIDVYANAVCSQNFCGSFCENIGFDTAVIGNGNAGCFESGLDIIGKTLCRTAYCINVHTIGACTDNAPQTTGTEFQIPIKTVTDRSVVTSDSF